MNAHKESNGRMDSSVPKELINRTRSHPESCSQQSEDENHQTMKTKHTISVVRVASAIVTVLGFSFLLRAQEAVPSASADVPKVGTFYVLSDSPAAVRRLVAPLPCPPAQGVFYQVSERRPDIFLVDCRAQARADAELLTAFVTLEAQITAAMAAEASLLAVESEGIRSNNDWSPSEDDGPILAYDYPSNTLYLELTAVSNQIACLIVHGTVAETPYAILSKEALADASWTLEAPLVEGLDSQTPTSVDLGSRTNSLFFWAVSLGDSDQDGLPDYWELGQGLNPNDPADAYADPDGDGYTNLDEYLLGLDPDAADRELHPDGHGDERHNISDASDLAHFRCRGQ
jgi:hypothetical protein